MALPVQISARCCRNALRQSSLAMRAVAPAYITSQHAGRARWQSTEAAAAPENPKIAQIVDQISQLTLLETADLVSSLKTRLNIPDLPVGGFALSAGGAAPGAAAPAARDEPAPARRWILLTQARVVRRIRQGQGDQGGQVAAGIELGGQQEVRGERAQGDEGECAEGGGGEDR
ncbi:54S ribosomal protein L12 [Coccidioides immitis H538.4]|uniref:54S ribosomal protein L12 n=1 Tax=Coccidioides immitis H538.4 TaxID=396776 RepID=A0A0J8RPK0_COCIT|nr:54S ribosomal protein L12 [Coccidioides immitis H538.4]